MRLEIRKPNIFFHGDDTQSRPQDPAEVHYDPVSGAGGFPTAGDALWFTPRHVMALIHPVPDFKFANPPFASPTTTR